MRDFCDAKAMARTLRASLSAKSFKITVSQSLELIAEIFGVADWNTLAAAIHGEARATRTRDNSLPPLPASGESEPVLPFSARFAMTQRRALAYADQRKHEYATLEHLLLALIDDEDAAAAMRASYADLGDLRENLTSYLDSELERLVLDDGRDPERTTAFNRVLQRAGLHAQGLGLPMVTGGHALTAIFSETRSPAARLLDEQGMTRQSVVDFIAKRTKRGR
jgi:hypothetical protein